MDDPLTLWKPDWLSWTDRFPLVREAVFDGAALAGLRRASASGFEVAIEQDARQSANFELMIRDGRAAAASDILRIFCQSGARAAVEALFPDGFCFLLRNCTVRRHYDQKSHLQFHFDANFMGEDAPILNLWVPLVDVGSGTPGLSFLDPSVDPGPVVMAWRRTMAEHQPAPDRFFPVEIVFSESKLSELLGADDGLRLFTPALSAGSVAGFHQLVLHATEAVPGEHFRESIEFRLGDPARLPRVYRERRYAYAVPTFSAEPLRLDVRRGE